MSKEECKIIGIISLKGGVGKTTTVANLGHVLASEFNRRVLIVDANFSAPNLALHIGLVNPSASIHDVLLDRIDITGAIHEHEAGFHIIPASYVSTEINPFKLRNRMQKLREYYDVILIDSSPTLNNEMLSTIIASDELLVVTSPDYPTLSTTLRAVKLAKQKNTPISGLILNRVRNKKFELSMHNIEEAAEIPILAVLPEDIRVPEAIASTMPVSLFKPNANASIEFKKLAACLVGERYKDPRLLPRLKALFRKDIPKDNVNRVIFENERI